MFNFFKVLKSLKQKKFIAIVAIFRNEKDYILEWISWHKSQGIENFIIFNNESDDGTTELLKRLARQKLIKFHQIPRQENAQIKAYNQAIQTYKNQFEILAFIDADEFIVPTDESKAIEHLKNIFKDKNVGAVGINWRVFGTNYHKTQPEGLVIRNYTLAANDHQLRNHFIKSIYRPVAIEKIYAHRAIIKSNYRYINTAQQELIFSHPKSLPTPTKNNQTSGVSAKVCNNKIRIHHYALKSEEEFIQKKRNKGDAIFGQNHIKSDGYFKSFNLNDYSYQILHKHLINFSRSYEEITKN